MVQSTENYNLLDEKWIPVLWNDGSFGHVGIRDAVGQAARIRLIGAANPMDRLAIFRFLLAVLYWCKGNPSTPVKPSQSDPFNESDFEKLEDNRDCFNLFGEGKRFYQYQTIAGDSDKKLAANYLIHEIPTGINPWHFRHATDKSDGLCAPCCAMGLLRLPLFATSGGRGKPPGINAKPPLYVVPIGRSLADTLRFSWRYCEDLGSPAWVHALPKLPASGEIPLLVGLTWIPRRVWLDRPTPSAARCIACGREENLVRETVFAGIGSTRGNENAPSRSWRDPHVLYSKSGQGEIQAVSADDALSKPDAAASQWTNVFVELLRNPKGLIEPTRLWAVGFATVKNDKYLEARECLFPSPSDDKSSRETLEWLDAWVRNTIELPKKLKFGKTPSPLRKHPDMSAMVHSIRPHLEGFLIDGKNELVSEQTDLTGRLTCAQGRIGWSLAQSLAPGFTVDVIERRRAMGDAVRNIAPTSETEKNGSK